DPEHELHDGRLGPVLGAAGALVRRPRAQPGHPAGAAARAVLGSVGEGRRRAPRGGRAARRVAVARPARRHQQGGHGVVKPRSRRRPLAGAALALLVALLGLPAAAQLTKVKVGWCARTVSAAATPFAIAMKLGWLKQEGIDLELVPMPGS